jgi:Effector protein
MPNTAFRDYKNTYISVPHTYAGDHNEYARLVLECLEDLVKIPLGVQMLDEIEEKQHKVVITPIEKQGGSNECMTVGDGCYVLLRQGMENWGSASFAAELTYSLDQANGRGLSLKMIAKRLSAGVSAVTTSAAENVKVVAQEKPTIFASRKFDKTGASIAKKGVPVQKSTSLDAGEVEEKLLKMAAGTLKRDWLMMTKRAGRSLGDDLIRLLNNPQRGQEFLRRGAGAGSKVSFDPTRRQSCWGDVLVERPPSIGLTHELIHAWRNAVGLRLYKVKNDNPACPDDEVMTVGMPPYLYEYFTENLIRAKWAERLEMRTAY